VPFRNDRRAGFYRAYNGAIASSLARFRSATLLRGACICGQICRVFIYDNSYRCMYSTELVWMLHFTLRNKSTTAATSLFYLASYYLKHC